MAKRKNTSALDEFANTVMTVGGPSSPPSSLPNQPFLYQDVILGNHKFGGPSQNDIIKYLSSLGTGDLNDLLGKLGINGFSMSDAQQQDWNKQILDSMLSAASENDARNYNQQMRDEQRLYDNPMNQLARLMGAGISRDAAIQLLSGGSGSGGSAALTGNAAPMSQGIAATQSDLNDIQAKMEVPRTVFGVIGSIAGAIGSLGSFGISAASLSTNLAATRAATAGQLLHNTQFAKTLQGIETASTVIGAISSAVDAGVIPQDHDFESSQDMIKTIRDKADTFEPFNALVSSGSLDSIARDVYSLNALNAGYKSWRESRDYGIDRGHIVRMQALDELFKSVDIDKVCSEINLNAQRINESIAVVINSTKLANSQSALNDALTQKTNIEQDLINSEINLNEQQYALQQPDLDWLLASIDDINSVRTKQVALDVACWQQYTPAEMQKAAESWLEDKRNLRTAIAIESYYYGDKLSAVAARHDPTNPPLSDTDFASWSVYMHNLFSNALPGKPATKQENDMLGDLAGSAVARWAVRKYLHLP